MTLINADDIERLRTSGQFDAEWYVTQYPDVAASGMDPAEHFLWIGARLGRRAKPSTSTNQVGQFLANHADYALDALFVDGTNGTSSTPYRVFRVADGLTGEGWKVQCCKGEDLFGMLRQDISARFVVIHRAPYWSPYTDFVEKMRAAGSIIVYDIDDLVFDEDVIPYIDGYKYLSDESKEGFIKGVHAYRDFILHADMCTSTTSFLVNQIAALGKPTYKIRNAISSENLEYFQRVGHKRHHRPSPFVVGYYSGTKTHQADFAVAAPALIQFMNETPDVVFRLIGEFDLNEYPELAHWQHIHRPGDMPRVSRVALMPHDVMIRDQFSCDLIIAPLEINNPFCESKSELKFFEASMAKCPVIATATQAFAEASINGQLAHLATTTEEWLQAFRDIYHSYDRALKRAEVAFNHCGNAYSQRFCANEAVDAYEAFSAHREGRAVASVTTQSYGLADVGVVIPDFSGPSGGHRKIFSVCEGLERAGKTVKIYVYSSRSASVIKKDIARFYCNLNAEVEVYGLRVDAHSHLIVTQWKTAYDARLVSFSGQIVYFVQDFEPMFFAVGSDYMRSLACYGLNYQIICYGEWVAAKLRDDLGVSATTIPFTMDKDVYRPPLVEGFRDIDILLFARPSQDRRCFDLISEGLKLLKSRHPNITIGLFGETAYDDPGFDYRNFGVISDLNELAELYHRAKVGICYSPTNPSQLGYEMLACGTGLVDVKIKHSELNFAGDSFVSYCIGTPESMVEACERLMHDPAELARRRDLGYQFIRAMPTDDSLGKSFVEALKF
jgi:glycosyltransferase involved in cell wall biosynthesis